LNTGFWYHHPNGKYQAFMTLTSNSSLHLENGGIDTSLFLDGNISQEEIVPVLLNRDTTRYQMRSGGIVQYYHLRSPIPKKVRDTSNLEQFPMLDADSTTINLGSISTDSLEFKNTLGDTILSNQGHGELDSLIVIDSLLLKDTLSDEVLDSIQVESQIIDSLGIVADSTLLKKRKRKKPTRYYDPNRLIPQRRQISIGHDLNTFRGFYKYADLDADSSFYKNWYVYNQGLQYRIAHSGLENSLFISSTSVKERSKGKTQQPRDFFKAGIKHSYNKYSQFKDTSSTNNLSIFGRADLILFQGLNLNTEGEFFLSGYNAGDFYLNGNLKLDIKNIGSLSVQALSQAFSPSIIQNKLIVSGVNLWHNVFQKTLETKIGGRITVNKTKTEIGINFQLLDNFIYHDTLGIVRQNDAIFAIPQLIIKQPVDIGIFHLENVIVFQNSNQDVFALPSIFSKHNMFIETAIFKKRMLVRLGAQGVFHTEYNARRYQPILGQFYNSDEKLKYFPQIDSYVSIKRGGFRFYVRAQNVASPIINEQLNVQFGFRTPNYPIPFRVIRFGISWMLLN